VLGVTLAAVGHELDERDPATRPRANLVFGVDVNLVIAIGLLWGR
jgi:hypothetical protein